MRRPSMYTVENAIIMAAGTSSRFAPLSHEKSKALVEVKGEILIERQIRQLKEAGIHNIYVITGYKSEQLQYLEDKFNIKLIHNPDYLTRNNTASIWAARHILNNSYVCSADNYFTSNPFEKTVEDSYYAAVFSENETFEWCLKTDENDIITNVTIGGSNAWYMLGHTFWSETFTRNFIKILEAEYDTPETKNLLWEAIYANHLDLLKMKIKRYAKHFIFEFDTLDELRCFDETYLEDTRSAILKNIARKLECSEKEITSINAYKGNNHAATGFTFQLRNQTYAYDYHTDKITIKES